MTKRRADEYIGLWRTGISAPPIITLAKGTMAGNHSRRIAVFPGQVDPITNGHLDVIRRGVALFDQVVVAFGINPEKRELFSHDERVEMIAELLKSIPGAKVAKYVGLTV